MSAIDRLRRERKQGSVVIISVRKILEEILRICDAYDAETAIKMTKAIVELALFNVDGDGGED